MNFSHFDDIDVDEHFFDNAYPSLNEENRNLYYDSNSFNNCFGVSSDSDMNLSVIHINIRSIYALSILTL